MNSAALAFERVDGRIDRGRPRARMEDAARHRFDAGVAHHPVRALGVGRFPGGGAVMLSDMKKREAFKHYCDGNRAPWVERILAAVAYRMLMASAPAVAPKECPACRIRPGGVIPTNDGKTCAKCGREILSAPPVTEAEKLREALKQLAHPDHWTDVSIDTHSDGPGPSSCGLRVFSCRHKVVYRQEGDLYIGTASCGIVQTVANTRTRKMEKEIRLAEDVANAALAPSQAEPDTEAKF